MARTRKAGRTAKTRKARSVAKTQRPRGKARRSKARTAEVSSLRPAIVRSLKQAKALRGRVASAAQLEDLIHHLESIRAMASLGSGAGSWARKFALAPMPRGDRPGR